MFYTKMCGKKVTESSINSPWGKIAFVSWGDPKNPPVLLLHGYLDSAATFTYLVEKLSDTHYYVGIDMPGHGKSDPFPPGLVVTKLHIVEAMRVVVEHMEWKTFTYLSHSFSFMMGVLYNTFYAGSIEKMIFLDPTPAIAWYYVINYQTPLWYKGIYVDYYENYEKLNFSQPKPQSRASWINYMARTRKLTREQSEVMLSRSFVPVENDKYLLSREQRVKHLAHIQIPTDTFYTIMNKLPATLVLKASQYNFYVKIEGARQYAENLIKRCQETLPHFQIVTAKGGHDFHITNPELLVDHIEKFLMNDRKFKNKSKL